MRLGQLSRKLEISNREVVSFLATKGIEIKDHPNVKVSDEAEVILIEEFGIIEKTPLEDPIIVEEPVKEEFIQEEVLVEPEIEETDISKEIVENNPSESVEEIIVDAEVTIEEEPIVEETELEIATESDDVHHDESITVGEMLGDDDDPESVKSFDHVKVIKAPKVELPGLKVVGKIDLPQPKVEMEEPLHEAPEESEEKSEESAPKVRTISHDRKNSRARLTPQQMEEKRQRRKKSEEKRNKEAIDRRERQEQKRLKELREAHYKAKVEKAPKSKSVKHKVSINKNSKKMADPKDQPKSMLGKFWKWLNT